MINKPVRFNNFITLEKNSYELLSLTSRLARHLNFELTFFRPHLRGYFFQNFN